MKRLVQRDVSRTIRSTVVVEDSIITCLHAAIVFLMERGEYDFSFTRLLNCSDLDDASINPNHIRSIRRYLLAPLFRHFHKGNEDRYQLTGSITAWSGGLTRKNAILNCWKNYPKLIADILNVETRSYASPKGAGAKDQPRSEIVLELLGMMDKHSVPTSYRYLLRRLITLKNKENMKGDSL